LSEFDLPRFLMEYAVILFSLSFHESAHAWVADHYGDPTAKMLGRITLNPVKHIDIIGTVVFPILAAVSGFSLLGWAKPVPVNPMNLKNPKRHGAFISASGPFSNLLLAVVFAAVFFLTVRLFGTAHRADSLAAIFLRLFMYGVLINVLLAVFNLIPVPPLDGGGILEGLAPDRLSDQIARFRPYSGILLLVLFYTGALSLFLVPVQSLVLKLLAEILAW
jgi:Zn-dependent protease